MAGSRPASVGRRRLWEHPDTATSMVEMLRYVMQSYVLATLPVDDVVMLIAPSVNRYLTGSAEDIGHSGL